MAAGAPTDAIARLSRSRAPWATSRVLLALLALQFATLALVQAWRDSPTVDEAVYVAAGVTAATRHDLRMNPEHPPLAKLVAALPALAVHPIIPEGSAWRNGDQFAYTERFVEMQREAGRLRWVLFASRLVPIMEALAMGILLYRLGTVLFSEAAGTVSAALWYTTPYIVGLAHFDVIDVPFTLAAVGFGLAMVHYVRRPSWRGVAVLGILLGAAMLVRHTGLLLALPAATTVAVRPPRSDVMHRGLAALLVVFIAWGFVWAGLRTIAPSEPTGRARTALAAQRKAGENDPLARLILVAPWPLEYEAGIGYLAAVSTGSPGFLLGRAWQGANPWYWPASVLVKVPFPTTLAVIAGLATLASYFWRRDQGVLAGLVVPVAVIGVFTIVQPRTIGLRYLVPVLAFIFVGAGPVAVRLGRRLPLAAGTLAVLQVLALWTSHPHSFAWTAPPFRPAYRIATDGNLDWGQDFDRLREWAGSRRVFVALVGPRGLAITEIPGAVELRDVAPSAVRGWVAVSASALTAYRRDELSWLRAYCSVGTIGGSIVLYRFATPPTGAPGPTAPRGRCPGAFSVRA